MLCPPGEKEETTYESESPSINSAPLCFILSAKAFFGKMLAVIFKSINAGKSGSHRPTSPFVHAAVQA